MSSLATVASTTPEASTIARAAARLDPYDALPDAARLVVTRTEYLWLSEADKAKLVEDLCTPTWSER